MKIDYKPLEEHLRKIYFISITGHVKTWFTRRVVGWYARPTGHASVPHTINRLGLEIEKHDLPLIVDCDPVNRNRIKILFKV